MSNYTKTTDFAAKDALTTGDPNKVVKGSEIDDEFDNIATAVATKADKASPTFTGTVTLPITDLDGKRFYLDADADTYFEAATDDEWAWTFGGVLKLTWTATKAGYLSDMLGLTPTDGNFMVGNGTTWVAESANTARTSLGLGTGDSPTFTGATLTGITEGHALIGGGANAVSGVNMVTKGNLLVGDGTTAPSALAVGTDGQVLTADSAEATGAKWATPNTAGLVLLATATASNDATIDFTTGINSTYDEYVLHIINAIPATDSVSADVLTSTDGGSSFDTTGYSVKSTRDGAAINTYTTGFRLTDDTTVGSDANENGVCGALHVFLPASAAYTLARYMGGFIGTTGVPSVVTAFGQRETTTAVNAIRFLFSSGNVESGEFKLYGVRKS